MVNRIRRFIDDFLRNKNGKLEGQRLSERWLSSRHPDMLKTLRGLDLLNSERLFCFVNGETRACTTNGCHGRRKFRGFAKGYARCCARCSMTVFNRMKTHGAVDVEVPDVPAFVTVNGKYSTGKIKQLSADSVERVVNRTGYLDSDSRIAERVYHVEHDLHGYPICAGCAGVNRNFKSSVSGYFPYCGPNDAGCSYRIPDNLEKRTHALRSKCYEKYVTFYGALGDDYTVTVFSKSEYETDRASCAVRLTHVSCGHEYSRGVDYQGHLKCPKCYPVRSRKQYEMYEALVRHDPGMKFNDRQFIKPKEIDILSTRFRFGVEYDSLSYHSYGYHAKIELNRTQQNARCHLEKTELVENAGFQLFRVFSNEWASKRDIWTSVIKNKMHVGEKLHARKCTVGPVPTERANEFLDKNHLQGRCNSSVRLGLYMSGELVSLMTFGKPRFSHTYEWELIRFCTKINTQVRGGASKLLKHFERAFNPESLVSYANRRWSTGALYRTLGFEFVRASKPNYFYFTGGDNAKLLSRVPFQKHKLEAKLQNFNPALTETQNMFDHGYRKIYDCGNLVFAKLYVTGC